jgi:uncharacterized cofD-like protein
MKKVTVLGGGTGSFVVLNGLKEFEFDINAIVTMMDSGGSTGRLRDQLGVLPPGDLRQCLVALSEAPELWRQLFLYRFENGDLKGHNFGNLFLSALEKVSTNYQEVIDTASYVLQTKGKVLPITFEKTHLCVEYDSGVVIKGEGNIDEDNPERSRIKRAFLDPYVDCNVEAKERIEDTDYLVVGPGDLYTSIIPILLVDHLQDVVKKSNAKIIYIMNLMTKAGQTTDYTAYDHVKDVTKYLGRAPETVILNNAPIPDEIHEWYASHQEHIVVNDLVKNGYEGNIIEADIVDNSQFVKKSSDDLTRSILRHHSQKLTQVLLKLLV